MIFNDNSIELDDKYALLKDLRQTNVRRTYVCNMLNILMFLYVETPYLLRTIMKKQKTDNKKQK